ncbi:hypothetical protein B0H14DRAFT_2773396 [Mycena olivaceomarginata]|nr:hypothetical protein B0H14DRAFT_2773396 [Mycena olivaceomarginata]
MHAAVFHDDLIPLEQFIGIYRNSPILSRYFRAYWWAEFNEVDRHLESMLNRTIDKNKRTLWIRGSNRRLCVDDTILNDDTGVFPSYSYLIEGSRWKPVREDIDIMSYNGPNHEAVVISSLALSHYHEFCDSDDFCASFCGHYSSHSHSFSISVHATATVGMVVKHHLSNCEVELPVNIAFLPLLDLGDISCGWSRGLSYGWCGPGEPEDVPSAIWHDKGLGGDLMPDSWRRYNLHQIFSAASIDRDVLFDHLEPWLGQANHIFSSLQIRSHHNQYVVINRVIFMCVFSPTTRSSFPSQGWLFVCPDDQLRSGPCSFRWPDCATYWSRDPFGAVRLSTEEAEEAGFPLIKLKIKVGGRAWNTIDYAALWRFHQAKGFVPNSQEIARHLGHPLYQLCDELAVEASFAHVTGESIEEDQTDKHDTANTSAMGDEDEHEAVDSEHGYEDEKPGADILLLSPGFRFLFRLPTAILALMVLCCLSYTPY